MSPRRWHDDKLGVAHLCTAITSVHCSILHRRIRELFPLSNDMEMHPFPTCATVWVGKRVVSQRGRANTNTATQDERKKMGTTETDGYIFERQCHDFDIITHHKLLPAYHAVDLIRCTGAANATAKKTS